MAGMLTVVNPRHKRRRARRRKTTNKRRTHRRRRHVARRAFSNPVRRRRRRVGARRRVTRRRRRHHNPAGFRMSGIVGTLTKGVALGAGAIATNLATNGVNKLLGANAVDGIGKIALKAGVGLVGLPMLLGFIPGGKKFANSVRLGAGIVVALDIFDMYIKDKLPDYFKDYSYGQLRAYESGQLEDWAPQAAMSGDADVYGGGVYS